MSEVVSNPLTGAYACVAEVLRVEMARLAAYGDEELAILSQIAEALDLPFLPPPSSEEERLVDDITWLPVAEGCVVAVLQAILHESATKPTFNFDSVGEAWRKHTDISLLADEIGLAPSDAEIALRLTTREIVDGAAFAKAAVVEMDGANYRLQAMEGTFVVESLGRSYSGSPLATLSVGSAVN